MAALVRREMGDAGVANCWEGKRGRVGSEGKAEDESKMDGSSLAPEPLPSRGEELPDAGKWEPGTGGGSPLGDSPERARRGDLDEDAPPASIPSPFALASPFALPVALLLRGGRSRSEFCLCAPGRGLAVPECFKLLHSWLFSRAAASADCTAASFSCLTTTRSLARRL